MISAALTRRSDSGKPSSNMSDCRTSMCRGAIDLS
jgi:hypothetical protein